MAIDNLARSSSPQIAIIGGGIVGVMLTLGLLRQNVSVRLYEQSGGFREIGAGIAFSACARRCSAYTLSNCESSFRDACLRSFESITQINIERADFLEPHDARNRLTQPHSGVNGPSNRSGTQALRCCVRG
jgi:hypothetical protein